MCKELKIRGPFPKAEQRDPVGAEGGDSQDLPIVSLTPKPSSPPSPLTQLSPG